MALSKLLFCYVVLFYFCTGTSMAQAVKDPSAQGWFWYEDPDIQERISEKEKQPATPIPSNQVPFSAKWIEENLPKLINKAIDDPSPENMANLAYAQRVTIDKSQKFGEAYHQAVMTDPFLDEENRVPSASYSNILFSRMMDKDKKSVLDYLGSIGGLWVFTDSSDKCSACGNYLNVVKTLAKANHFPLREVSITTAEGMTAAKQLKLKVTPTTVLAVPPAGYYLVSQGLLAQDQLEDRILIAATAYKLLPKDLEEKANPYSKGVLTNNDLKGIELNADPSLVMKTLREKINKSQGTK